MPWVACSHNKRSSRSSRAWASTEANGSSINISAEAGRPAPARSPPAAAFRRTAATGNGARRRSARPAPGSPPPRRSLSRRVSARLVKPNATFFSTVIQGTANGRSPGRRRRGPLRTTHRLTGYEDCPAVRPVKPAERAQQRGLPASGRADDRDDLAGADVERQVGQHRHGVIPTTKPTVEPGDGQHLGRCPLLAGDVWRLNRLCWVMTTSLLKTLACKHDSSVSKMAGRYQATIQTTHGPRRCFQASVQRPGRNPLTATFGGLPLRRQRKAVLIDRKPVPATVRRKELIHRLLNGRCELCQHTGEMRVHHVAKLAHLVTPGQPQPVWAAAMAKRRRKTLVVCARCHDTIHHRRPAASSTE